MTPDQLKAAGIRLYGRGRWKSKLAAALAVDVSTIHRLTKRAGIPGPYEVAVRGLIENKKAMTEAEKVARKLGLVPRKRRKRRAGPRVKKDKPEKITKEGL